MDFLNKKVLHKMFGEGKIYSYRESEIDYTSEVKEVYIGVEFDSVGPKKFLYPTSFEQFLKFKDEELQNEIPKLMEQRKIEQEEKRQREEEVRKYLAEKKKQEVEDKKSKRKPRATKKGKSD